MLRKRREAWLLQEVGNAYAAILHRELIRVHQSDNRKPVRLSPRLRGLLLMILAMSRRSFRAVMLHIWARFVQYQCFAFTWCVRYGQVGPVGIGIGSVNSLISWENSSMVGQSSGTWSQQICRLYPSDPCARHPGSFPVGDR